jgi:hypothetical protein
VEQVTTLMSSSRCEVKMKSTLIALLYGSTSLSFSPASLFASGEEGDAWIPEREFCYTKSGGGLYERVTTTGDETARITGMANGINADQDVFASRPIYSEGGGLSWLAFDGVDDALAGGSIVLKLGWYSCLGLNILTRGGSNSDILGLGSRGSAPNSLSMSVRTDVVEDLRASIRLEDYIIVKRRGDYEIAANFVGEGGEDTGNVFTRVNGGTIDTLSSAALTGPGSAVAVRLGDTDVEFKFYGAVLRMAATSESDKDKTRAYFATKSGVTL